MAISAFKGPVVVYGDPALPATPSSGVGVAQEYNGWRAPSMFDRGVILMDPRFRFSYQPGQIDAQKCYGWLGSNDIILLDQVPSTLTTAGIAALQVPVAGVALTLVTSTAAGITVGASVTNAATGALVTGLLVIDGAMASVGYGQTASVNVWDPTTALARGVKITSAGDDSSGTAKVVGFDIYGFPMSEVITLSNATSATSKKAFKYIQSITPAGTLSGSNVSVGQSDVIGFMMRVDRFQYVKIYSPDTTLISATTGWLAADATSPATTTTGDVRGTYALQTASNNTRRLVITARLTPGNISSAAGLVGVTQV